MDFYKQLAKYMLNLKECEWCESNIEVMSIEIFNPFEVLGTEYLLCMDCLDNIHETATMCEGCYRYIYNSNGMRINIRYDDKLDAFYCVDCLQKEWLINGMKEFMDADFFNYSDLSDNKFELHDSYFCRSKQSYKEVEKVFESLKESGKIVIVNINSSGLGLEHYISLYTKSE